MTQAQSAEQQFLMGGESIPGAFTKHDGPGTRRGGKVTDTPVLRQQTDFKSGDLLTWNDGGPRMQLVVTVQTELRDPQNPDDDGRRRFYIKGNAQKAAREAVQKSGAKGIGVGDDFYMTRTGQEPPKNRGEDGAWTYSAEHTVAAQGFVTQPEPVAQPAPQTAEAAGIPAQNNGASELEAALAKLPAEQAAAFRAANLTLDGIRAMGIQV